MVQFDPEIGRGPDAEWLMDFIADRVGGEVVWRSALTDGLVAMRFAPGDAEEGGDYLRRHWPYVHKADRTVRGRPGGMLAQRPLETNPNDPNFGDQWGLQLIRAPEAWDIRTDGSGKIVAVVDQGVFWPHPDLVDNMLFENGQIKGAAFMLPEAECAPWVHPPAADDPIEYESNFDYAHGTPIAAIIGARGNNSLGIAGVAWEARIMPVRFGNNLEMPYCNVGWCVADPFLSAIAALEYAIMEGASIINLSQGWRSDPADALYSTLKNAETYGVLIVACAHNDAADLGVPNPLVRRYPSIYTTMLDNLIAVAAVDSAYALRGYSNYSNVFVQIAAPGGDTNDGIRVLGPHTYTIPNSGNPPVTIDYCPDTEYFGGTSSAAPFVAGAAALVWSEYPSLTVREVRDRILDRARHEAGLEAFVQGGRVLDLYEALRP